MKNPLEIVKSRFPSNKISFHWENDTLQAIQIDGHQVKVMNLVPSVISLLQYHDISVDEVIVDMLVCNINNTLDKK